MVTIGSDEVSGAGFIIYDMHNPNLAACIFCAISIVIIDDKYAAVLRLWFARAPDFFLCFFPLFAAIGKEGFEKLLKAHISSLGMVRPPCKVSCLTF